MGSYTKLFLILSFVLLLTGLLLEYIWKAEFFNGWIKILWYTSAYLPVAFPVLKEAWNTLKRGEIFTEFFLMSIATMGAFAIGEYPEGVAVMLFYTLGELFQASAVNKAKLNITALLDVRPKQANVLRNNIFSNINPEAVKVGEVIQVRVGEKVPLDGKLLSKSATLNTSAITGESQPRRFLVGEKILAGYINLENVVELRVDKIYSESSIARILELVQNATARKSKTELLIRRLAKIYTPIVVYLAIAICFLPYFFVADYQFSDWLYRALIFLVISCPCALVISIPLGYFGGLGAASKNGLLFKGATYLDQLSNINTLVFDKTGTVTKGVFKINSIICSNDYSEESLMKLLMAVESKSTHPIAKAIMNYSISIHLPTIRDVQEIAGKGMTGIVDGHSIVAGNKQLMNEFKIALPPDLEEVVETNVFVSVNGKWAGTVEIADEIKEDAKTSIEILKNSGIQSFLMLSGDKDTITQKVAHELGIKHAIGDLLPEQKLQEVERIKKDTNKKVAFVGDGINDAPVLAASDVGIAMGALGSDVAIETADVVIQTDQLSKISTGIKIGKTTQRIIWQNITLALGVKLVVLILGALGLASMWAAVFADVGVALLAILNAVRLQRMF